MKRELSPLPECLHLLAALLTIALSCLLIPTRALAFEPASNSQGDTISARMSATNDGDGEAPWWPLGKAVRQKSSVTPGFHSSSAASALRLPSREFPAAPLAPPIPARIGRHFEGSSYFRYDSDAAVGPRHFAELNNISFRVYNKYTGVLTYETYSLFAEKMNLIGSKVDQNIRFDHASNRWIALCLTSQPTAGSGVFIGVSATDDPAGDWASFFLKADPASERTVDYPRLGIDAAGMYVVASMVPLVGANDGELGLFSIPESRHSCRCSDRREGNEAFFSCFALRRNDWMAPDRLSRQ